MKRFLWVALSLATVPTLAPPAYAGPVLLDAATLVAGVLSSVSPIRENLTQRDVKGVAPHASVAFTPRLEIQATGNGDVSGYLHNGKLVWRRTTGDGHVATLQTTPDGTLVIDESTVLDRFGRVVAHGMSPPTPLRRQSLSGIEEMASWDALFLLTDDSDSDDLFVAGPTVDAQGVAWAVITRLHDDGFTVELTHSIAGTNDWQPCETIFESTGYAIVGAPKVNPLGQLVFVFRRLPMTPGYSLEMLTFDPITHDITHETAYSSDDFFQAVDFAIDADGNIVVVMNADPFGVTSLWHDGVTWHGPFDVGVTAQASSPALIHNKEGTAMYLVYSVASRRFRARGVYTHPYVGPPDVFGRRSRVPGSQSIKFRLFLRPPPGVVDQAGEATIFYDAYTLLPGVYHVKASRTTDGFWRRRPATLAVLDHPVGITGGLEDADVSSVGDVMLVYESVERRGKCICAHHYSAAADQWSPRETLVVWDTAFSQRVRVAFLGPTSAIAVFNAPQPTPTGPFQLTSMLFDGSWQDTLLDIPEEHFSLIFSLETTPASSNAFLIFNSNPGGRLLDTNYATLLRTAQAQP